MSTQPQQPEEPCPLEPGEVVSQRYSLELFIGEGSFGWVFSALDLSHSLRRVAIKVLRSRHATREDMLRRLEERELALLLEVQRLQPTPHVVRALEPGVQWHEGLCYLVLEFIDGPSLREVLDRGHAWEPEQVRRLGLGLARGLAAIHAAGGVHRDLKPANIRMRGVDEPVIVDFGTALTLWTPRDLTTTGQAPMTPRYASPEQLAGRESTAASDVYSWGVLLYEVLTGALPSTTGDGTSSGTARRFSGPKAPRELLEPVLRCLDYAPERRPTARELIEAFSAVPARRVPPRWLPRALGLLVLVPLVLGGLQRFWPPRPLPPASPPPVSSWSHSYGDAAAQPSVRMVRDPQGNLLLTGGFNGSLKLGEELLTSAGSEDLLVASLDPQGRPRWSHRFGDSEKQRSRSLAVDSTGGLLVFGDFEGTLDFGPSTLVSPQGSKLFLARFDAEGHPLWSRSWGEGALMDASAMAVAADGTITLLGNFAGSIDFGCGRTFTSQGATDVFLVRLSADGTQCRWGRSFGDQEPQSADALALDAEGNIAIWGAFVGTLDFGGQTLVQPGPLWDNYLAVFDARGRLSWSMPLHASGSGGTPERPSPEGETYTYPTWTLQFSPAGELVFLGDMTPPSDTGPATVPVPSVTGVYVARFDAHGQLVGRQRLGDSRAMSSGQLAPTARGGLLIAGSVRGSVDLGDGPFAGSGGPGTDLFVLELGRQGEFWSARRFRGTSALEVWSVGEDPAGSPLVAGVFEGSLELGTGLLSTAGNSDLFIARLDPAASAQPRPAHPVCLQPPSGLSAWYPLDGPDPGAGRGDTKAGEPLAGARGVAGRERGVLDLEAGYFEAPAQAALEVGEGDFSLSLWVRTSDTRDESVLLDKRSQLPPHLGPLTGYSLWLDHGQLVFQLADGKGSASCGRSGSCTNYMSGHFVADGAWHLVTVTVARHESEGGGTFFVDGDAVAGFSPGSRSGSLDNRGPLRLGSRFFAGEHLFKGLLDEVALWKRALSANEVKRLYDAGSAGMCRPASAHSPESSRKP